MANSYRAENIRVGEWLDFLIEKGYVARSKHGIHVWTIAGADHMAERLTRPHGEGYNITRDPENTTPVNYCKVIAEVIDVETAKVFGGAK